jgi:hypothetical protein
MEKDHVEDVIATPAQMERFGSACLIKLRQHGQV